MSLGYEDGVDGLPTQFRSQSVTVEADGRMLSMELIS